MKVRRFFAALAASAVLAALWLAVNPSGEFPLNDDWTYASPVRHFCEEGRFILSDSASVMDLPAVALGIVVCKSFGFRYALLRACTFFWALLGVFFMVKLLEEAAVPIDLRRLAAAAFFFNPVYFLLAFTFHSDVPFAALMLGAAYFFLKAEASGRARWDLAASVAGGAAVLTRQPGIVFFAGAAVCFLFRGRGPRRWLALLGPAAAMVALFYAWFYWVHGPTWGAVGLVAHDADQWMKAWESLRRTSDMLVCAGLFSAPFALTSAREKPRPAFALGASLALTVGLYVLFRGSLPYDGNVFHSRGLGPLTGYAADQWKPVSALWRSPWMWSALTAGAAVSLWTLLRRSIPGSWSKAEAALLCVVFPPAFCFLTPSVYLDRYMLPSFAGLLALAAMRSKGRASWPSWAAVGVLAAVSVAGTRDYFAWNRAKWSFGLEAAKALSLSPGDIANGLDWNAHWTYDAAMSELRKRKPLAEIGQFEWMRLERKRAVITFAPDMFPARYLLDRRTYRSPLAPQGGALYLFRVPGWEEADVRRVGR